MNPFTITPKTWYEIECWREGRLVWEERFHNLVVTVGKNALLDVMFRTGGAASAWYVGLVNNAGFSAYDATDTMSSHAGWVEGVPYSNVTRPAYVPAAAAAGSMDNGASKAVYAVNATQTVRGAFLTNVNTKSGTLGTLYGVGDFSVARSVITGDTLNVKITLTD